MAIKAVLLDLDGTILNSLSDLTDSVNYMLSHYGFPTHSEQKIRSIVGNGVKNLILRALPEGASDELFEEALSIYKAHYEKNKANKTAPYEGVMDMLSRLRDRGIKLAIVSNKHDDAVQGLSEQFFSGFMSFTIGNRDGIEKKPAPDMIDLTLENLRVSRDEAVYVGDSEVDILTARNSRIPCISVTWGFRDKDLLIQNGAEILVDTPSELVSAVDNLFSVNSF